VIIFASLFSSTEFFNQTRSDAAFVMLHRSGYVESPSGDVLSDPLEISVATDKPTLVFRDWYEALLTGH
jgi:hypothetical protein